MKHIHESKKEEYLSPTIYTVPLIIDYYCEMRKVHCVNITPERIVTEINVDTLNEFFIAESSPRHIFRIDTHIIPPDIVPLGDNIN